MLCKGYRTAGDSKQHHTPPITDHHGPCEGIYPTVWKWPLRAKLTRFHRWVFMVIVPKGRHWMQYFRVCSGTYRKDKARHSVPGPGQWCMANTRQEAREPPKALFAGGNVVPSHLQIQWDILLEHISSASTSHCPAPVIRAYLPVCGLREQFHVRLHQPALCRPCNYSLLLLYDY